MKNVRASFERIVFASVAISMVAFGLRLLSWPDTRRLTRGWKPKRLRRVILAGLSVGLSRWLRASALFMGPFPAVCILPLFSDPSESARERFCS